MMGALLVALCVMGGISLGMDAQERGHHFLPAFVGYTLAFGLMMGMLFMLLPYLIVL